MPIGIATGHDHRHVHDRHGHGATCSCRACRYDGSVTDLLRYRTNVERIASGGGIDDADEVAHRPADAAPAGSPLRTVQRMQDESDNFRYHHSSSTVSLYA